MPKCRCRSPFKGSSQGRTLVAAVPCSIKFRCNVITTKIHKRARTACLENSLLRFKRTCIHSGHLQGHFGCGISGSKTKSPCCCCSCFEVVSIGNAPSATYFRRHAFPCRLHLVLRCLVESRGRIRRPEPKSGRVLGICHRILAILGMICAEGFNISISNLRG